MNSAFQSKAQKNAGFSLLEVLIVMAILVFVSFGIYQAVTQTFRLRASLTAEGNFYNSLRLGMSILQRDLTLIYSPTALAPPKPPQNPQDRGQNPVQQNIDNLGVVTQFWLAGDLSGLRFSRFQGSDNKISFVTMSHIRIYKDTPESEFAKVSYELKRDTKDPDNRGNYVLVKTESPNAFDMEDSRDPLARSYEILRGIKTLSFSFLQRDRDTWKTSRSWDSDKEEYKNNYPDVIEVKLELVGPDHLYFEGKFKFKPEFPFNGIPARL
jgi:prepilin-type N-terminal cleavage/methylation domain-containing protein